jgi:hypothetical protein
MGSQAVRLLLLFSPSAASSCRGTPDPTLRLQVRPAGWLRRARVTDGPRPGRISRSRAGLPSLLAEDAWSGAAGPGRAGPDPARPGRTQGFDCRHGGADAGPPHRGGVGHSPPCSHPSGSLRCYVCVCCNRCCADLGPSRGLGVDASALLRRRCAAHGSLMAPHGSSHAGLRPSLL